MKNKQLIIIGIAGSTASGKSLLANTIISELGSNQVTIIPEDSYYKDNEHIAFEQRADINYDHPDAFEHELLYEHLQQLHEGKTIEVPLYDHAQHTRKRETRRIGGYSIIVLEGILLLTDPKLRKLIDIRIFMDTPLDICLLRRLKRDIIERQRSLESVLKQYEKTVRPMYLQFIEPSKRYADIIVPRGGENRIAIEIIKSKIRELLNESSVRSLDNA